MIQVIAEKLMTASKVIRVLWGTVVRREREISARRTFVRDLIAFIDSQSSVFRRRLLVDMDPGRVVALMAFQRFLFSNPMVTNRVAVVSGSITEPELRLLDSEIAVDFLNFADKPELFDLQKDWSKPSWDIFVGAYDLVLCEQVLEHLLNPKLAVENLALLLRPGGVLHLSVPSVNNRHGEPTYFYSGFAPQALEFWVGCAGLRVLESSSFLSDKGSRMYSTTDWAPLAESGPTVFFLKALSSARKEPQALIPLVARRIANSLRYPFQLLFSSRPTTNAVVSWVFAKKPSKC